MENIHWDSFTLYDILYLGPNDNSGGHPCYLEYNLPIRNVLDYINDATKGDSFKRKNYYVQVSGTGYLKEFWAGEHIFREFDPENPWFKHKKGIEWLKGDLAYAKKYNVGISLGVGMVETLEFLLAELDKK